MAKFIFETTVVCTVEVEADSAEEAMMMVEDLDPCADYCDQYMNEDWTLKAKEEA